MACELGWCLPQRSYLYTRGVLEVSNIYQCSVLDLPALQDMANLD